MKTRSGNQEKKLNLKFNIKSTRTKSRNGTLLDEKTRKGEGGRVIRRIAKVVVTPFLPIHSVPGGCLKKGEKREGAEKKKRET